MANQIDNITINDDTTGLDRTINPASDDIFLSVNVTLQSGAVFQSDNIKRGPGNPAGVVSGNEGDIFLRTDVSNGRLYVNTDGTVGGWSEVSLPSINGPRIYPNSATDPILPPPVDGDMYYNTVLSMEMRYDGGRSKWLSTESVTLQFGRNGRTAVNQFYRGVNGRVLSATTGYPSLYNGTVVAFGYTRTDTDAATFEVTSSGVTVASVASAANSGTDLTINANVNQNSVLALRNAAGGNRTANVQAWAKIKWRI